MESLRVLNMDKIKAYHNDYYAPHNLCLVVTGRLSAASLLNRIEETIEEDTLRRMGSTIASEETDEEYVSAPGGDYHPPKGWVRPFIETVSSRVPVLEKDEEIVVEFPAKEERFGEVTMVMLGPKPDQEIVHAVSSSQLS